MAQAQMIEGTTEEVTRRLLETFPSQNLRVFVEPEETDLGVNLPDPTNTVRDRAHLVELLREGLNSPTQEVTEESWERKREEVRRRHAARQP
jgi:hypothetical protein